MNDLIFKKFLNLSNQLSLKNLTYGEVSYRKAMVRQKQIKKEWVALEKENGNPVTEQDIWVLSYQIKL